MNEQLERICATPGVGAVKLWPAGSSPGWTGTLASSIGPVFFVTGILPTVQDVLDSLEYEAAKFERRNGERPGCYTLR